MGHFSTADVARLNAAVTASERGTALEIVVRVARQSGTYTDIAWAIGSLGALAGLVAALFVPMEISPVLVSPAVVASGAIAAAPAVLVPAIRRRLIPRARRDAQVAEGASAAFHTKAVSATRDRTGVLVYASILEDQIVVLPDHPLEGRFERAAWGRVSLLARTTSGPFVSRIEAVIAALGELGRHALPRGADDANELPDDVDARTEPVGLRERRP
jgi:putative membrane protein